MKQKLIKLPFEMTIKKANILLNAIFKIMNIWDLPESTKQILLGNPDKLTFIEYKTLKVLTIPPYDFFLRGSHILGIYKSLHTLNSDRSIADTWINKPNEYFDGKSAHEYLKEGGFKRLEYVRKYLYWAQYGAGLPSPEKP